MSDTMAVNPEIDMKEDIEKVLNPELIGLKESVKALKVENNSMQDVVRKHPVRWPEGVEGLVERLIGKHVMKRMNTLKTSIRFRFHPNKGTDYYDNLFEQLHQMYTRAIEVYKELLVLNQSYNSKLKSEMFDSKQSLFDYTMNNRPPVLQRAPACDCPLTLYKKYACIAFCNRFFGVPTDLKRHSHFALFSAYHQKAIPYYIDDKPVELAFSQTTQWPDTTWMALDCEFLQDMSNNAFAARIALVAHAVKVDATYNKPTEGQRAGKVLVFHALVRLCHIVWRHSSRQYMHTNAIEHEVERDRTAPASEVVPLLKDLFKKFPIVIKNAQSDLRALHQIGLDLREEWKANTLRIYDLERLYRRPLDEFGSSTALPLWWLNKYILLNDSQCDPKGTAEPTGAASQTEVHIKGQKNVFLPKYSMHTPIEDAVNSMKLWHKLIYLAPVDEPVVQPDYGTGIGSVRGRGRGRGTVVRAQCAASRGRGTTLRSKLNCGTDGRYGSGLIDTTSAQGGSGGPARPTDSTNTLLKCEKFKDICFCEPIEMILQAEAWEVARLRSIWYYKGQKRADLRNEVLLKGITMLRFQDLNPNKPEYYKRSRIPSKKNKK